MLTGTAYWSIGDSKTASYSLWKIVSEQIWEPLNVKIIYSLANEHGCMRQFKVRRFAFPAVFCYFMPFSSKLISESRAKKC